MVMHEEITSYNSDVHVKMQDVSWKLCYAIKPFRVILFLQVNTVVAVGTFLIMIAIVVLSFYKSPVTSGLGVIVFLLGAPLYGIILCTRDRQGANSCMGMYQEDP